MRELKTRKYFRKTIRVLDGPHHNTNPEIQIDLKFELSKNFDPTNDMIT